MPKPFQTVAIVGKPDGVNVAEPLNALIALLRARGLRVRLDSRTAEFASVAADEVLARGVDNSGLDALLQAADLAVAVGGDGAMLGLARAVARHDVPLGG